MIKKYTFGEPFNTEAVTELFSSCEGLPEYGTISLDNGFTCVIQMEDEDIVYGLGEANRGINKRGYIYESRCKDDPVHTEDKISFYAAHNFVVVSGSKNFGMFFDYPGIITFDIGYTKQDTMRITCEEADLDVYIITGDSAYDIVKQFRKIIGRSYIPPKFAFGYGQSRWGYKTQDDFREVVNKHREHHVPLDMVYMDIDYMERYKDFTINKEFFPDFKAFVDEMKEEKIHLVPIIDAGVKIEDGYETYEEGKEKGYFCKREDGTDFEAAVWPGWTHFPDMLNKEAREWFGSKYETLLSAGIDAFWNDMNEPSIFYSQEGLAEVEELIRNYKNDGEAWPHGAIQGKA